MQLPFIALLLAASHVSAHGAIVAATGDQGGSGSAIGIDPTTPRDGTDREPFQRDSTRFQGPQGDICGETLAAGDNDIEAGTQEVMNQSGDQLPQVSPGGQVQMTLHQVNADGAGPYECMIDQTGTGTQWEPMEVTQNVDGIFLGLNIDGNATPHPLTAQAPANMQCTGNVAGQNNVCMIRCENAALAGPFGGCVPIQQAGAGNGNNANNNNNNNNGDADNAGNVDNGGGAADGADDADTAAGNNSGNDSGNNAGNDAGANGEDGGADAGAGAGAGGGLNEIPNLNDLAQAASGTVSNIASNGFGGLGGLGGNNPGGLPGGGNGLLGGLFNKRLLMGRQVGDRPRPGQSMTSWLSENADLLAEVARQHAG